MAFNASNPVSVGLATKKDHYDRVFDNTVLLKTSISDSGHLKFPTTQTKSATYSALETDDTILCSGTWTLSLYAASGNAGRILFVKNTGTGVITIDGNGSETIDGATTQEIALQYMALTLYCDGSNWHIV